MVNLKVSLLSACMLFLVWGTARSQEAPELKPKNFETHSYDATKLPSDAGFLISVDQTPQGNISLKDNRVLIVCQQGESYRMSLTPDTEIKFSPEGDYTVEFKVQVPKNTGRGFDFIIKDGLNISKLFVVHHHRIFFNGEKEPIMNIQSKTVPRVIRCAVERSKGLMHIYVDGKFARTAELTRRKSSPSLLFAKGNVNAEAEIYLDYITIDESGAYAL